MSAAHCYQKDTITIAAGSLDKRYPSQRVDSLSFIKHPKYGEAACLDYDYAIILTRNDFDFSDPFVQLSFQTFSLFLPNVFSLLSL